jgi:hypothetical protein
MDLDLNMLVEEITSEEVDFKKFKNYNNLKNKNLNMELHKKLDQSHNVECSGGGCEKSLSK